MLIRRLRESDDRSEFDCGSKALNDRVRKYAAQNQEKHASVTFVALDEDGVRVVGFVTVCAGSLRAASLPKHEARGLSRHPQPTMVLARVGVDKQHRGQGIASSLLVRAYEQSLLQAEATGCIGIEVESKSGAESFYENQGFVRLTLADGGERTRLFLPISAVQDALEDGD